MTPDSVRRALLAASCVTAPPIGLVAVIVTPALATTARGEMEGIAASPGRFYVYALCMLLSSLLLVPATFALMELVRPRRPSAALVAGLIAQVGMLVAVGDSAAELVFWQMGAHGHDTSAMVAVTDSYDNVAGTSVIYAVGGLCALAGVLALGILLWRTRALPAWAAAALPLGLVANIVGFSTGSRPTLIGSYALLALALIPAAVRLRDGRSVAALEPSAPAPSVVVER